MYIYIYRFRPLESFLFLFFRYNIPFHRNDPTIYMRIKKPKALRKESKKNINNVN